MNGHSILTGNSPRRHYCMCHNSQQTVDARYLPALQGVEIIYAFFRLLITAATKCALVQPEILLQSSESVKTRVPGYQIFVLQVFNFAKVKFESTTAIFCFSFSLKPVHLFLLDLRFLERRFETCSNRDLEHIKILSKLSTMSRPISRMFWPDESQNHGHKSSNQFLRPPIIVKEFCFLEHKTSTDPKKFILFEDTGNLRLRDSRSVAAPANRGPKLKVTRALSREYGEDKFIEKIPSGNKFIFSGT